MQASSFYNPVLYLTHLGFIVIDTVFLRSSIGPVSVDNQSVGVHQRGVDWLVATGLGVAGVLGLGPTHLTDMTVTRARWVPSVMRNLSSAGAISGKQFGISFESTTEGEPPTGHIYLGIGDYEG